MFEAIQFMLQNLKSAQITLEMQYFCHERENVFYDLKKYQALLNIINYLQHNFHLLKKGKRMVGCVTKSKMSKRNIRSAIFLSKMAKLCIL